MDRRINPITFYVLSGLSVLVYIVISYLLERSQTTALVSLYSILFICYLGIVYPAQQQNLSGYILLGIFFRLTILFAFPNLSDDVFRFVWDGRLLLNGVQPFDHIPSYYIDQNIRLDGIDQALFEKLNSPEYYTVYPPIAQFVFWLSVVLSPGSIYGSVVVIRLCIILAEIGSIYLMVKLLKKFDLNTNNVLWYVFNPLVILELTGNLHFEVFMIFFVLLAMWLLVNSKLLLSTLSFALAVGAKLIPLIYLPLFYRRLKINRLVIFYSLTGLFILIIFSPFIVSGFSKGFGSSLSLYFQKFEFNASVYYLVREIGFWMKGYNIIDTAGKVLAAISFISIMAFAIFDNPKKSGLLQSMMWVNFIYLVFANTIHPWYVTPLVALSVFTSYRFPVVWSALIFLTYIGYSYNSYSENLWITTLEYAVVFGYMIYEIFKKYSIRTTNLSTG